jgi:uncharacterized repeat protein (TIGR03803 family)
MRSKTFLSGLCPTTRFACLLLFAGCLSLFASLPAYAQAYKVLHSFTGPTSDGMDPDVSIREADGTLYGTTCYGGRSYNGTAFTLSPKGRETILYNFLAGYGSCPGSLLAWKGEFYGDAGGGSYGKGVIFKLDQKRNERVLHSFYGSPNDGAGPSLSFHNANGVFYGTTFKGGTYDWGTVFRMNTAGKVTVLYSFTGGADGSGPTGVVGDDEGNLYGTTVYGGEQICRDAGSCGTVFKLDTAGNLTTLHMFSGGTDGAQPQGGVIRDASGNLYGTTDWGGSDGCSQNGCGTVFKVDASGKEKVLYSFTGPPDGEYPLGNLVRDVAGNLYGTTFVGGETKCDPNNVGCGIVFKLDTTGKETVLHTFTSAPDGAYPFRLLLLDTKGDLYGTTYVGGDVRCSLHHVWKGCGTVFRLTP